MWQLLGGLLGSLFAQLEVIYLANLNGKKDAQLEHAEKVVAAAKRSLQQAKDAQSIKLRLDTADAPAAERMRAWYAHAFGRGEL